MIMSTWSVPPGFATTAQSYWQLVDANGLRETMVDSRHRPNYRLHAPALLRDGRGFIVPHSTQHLNGRRANVINTLFF